MAIMRFEDGEGPEQEDDPLAGMTGAEDDPLAGMTGGEPAQAAEQAAPPMAELDTISARGPDPTLWESIKRGAANAFGGGSTGQAIGIDASDLWDEFIKGQEPGKPGYGTGPAFGRTFGRGMAAPQDPRSEYEVEMNRQDALLAEADRAHPLGTGGGRLFTESVAALPAGIAAGGSELLAGSTLPAWAQRAAISAGAAAPLSAITGFLESRGEDALEVATDTLKSLGIGTATGVLGGEAGHQAATRLSSWLGRKLASAEAQRIEAAHGPEAKQIALDAANVDSEEGRAIRALVHAGESPEALAAHESAVYQQLAERGPGDEVRALAQRAADPQVQRDHQLALMKELAKNGPTDEIRALAARAADPANVDRQTLAIADHLTKIAKLADVIQDHETIGHKIQIARAYFAKDQIDPLTAINTADDLARQVRASVEHMLIPGKTQPGTEEWRLLTRVKPHLEEYFAAPRNPAQDPYDMAAEKWGALDQLKRDIQKKLRNAKFEAPETEELNRLEGVLREALEQPELWGEGAAGLQKQRNRAWFELLKLEDTRKGNPSSYTTDIEGIPSLKEARYRPLWTGDKGPIKGAVQGAGEIEGHDIVKKIGNTADAEARLADALTDHILSSPDMRARATESARAAAGIRSQLSAASAEQTALRDLNRLPPTLREPTEAPRLIQAAERALPDPETETLRQFIIDQGGDPKALDAILGNVKAESAAARDVASYPAPLQDPSRARGMVANAGSSVPDADMRILEEYAARTGTDITPIRAQLGQRAEEVGAAQAMAARERGLPDPGLAERLLGRLSGGASIPYVGGMANEAAATLRAPARTLSQRARIIAQLETQDPANNAAARAALNRMRTGGSDTISRTGAYARTLGSAQAADTKSEGHKLEAVVSQRLLTAPQSLGPYAQTLRQAQQNGTLGVALYRLEGDPRWKATKATLAPQR